MTEDSKRVYQQVEKLICKLIKGYPKLNNDLGYPFKSIVNHKLKLSYLQHQPSETETS